MHTAATPSGTIQIEWRNNEVSRFAMPTAGLACKHQVRGTGYRDGLRSNSTMKRVPTRVQRKIFIAPIKMRAQDVKSEAWKAATWKWASGSDTTAWANTILTLSSNGSVSFVNVAVP